MSDMRRRYAMRLAGRCVILAIAVLLCIFAPEAFAPLQGMRFFIGFSLLHVLWIIWVIDMIAQLVPVRAQISPGSQKLWRMRFKPIREMIGRERLKRYVLETSRSALWVLILWSALIAVIGALSCASCTDKLCTQSCRKLRPKADGDERARKGSQGAIYPASTRQCVFLSGAPANARYSPSLHTRNRRP